MAAAACATRGPPRHCSATLLAAGTSTSCLFVRLTSLEQNKVLVAQASWDNAPERQKRVPQGNAFTYEEATLELPAWRTPEALAGLLRDKYGGAIDKAHLFPVIKPSGSGRSKLGKALGDGLAAALGRTNYAHTFTDGVLGRWAGLGGAVSPDFYQAAHQKAAKLGFGTPVKPYAEADQDIYMLRLAVANVVGDPADKPPAPSPLSVPESPDSTANLAPEPPAPSPTANNAALDTLQGRAEEHARQLVDLDKRVTRLERFLRLLRLLLWLAEVLFVTVLYAALLGLLALSVAFFGPHGIAPALPVSVATNTTPTTALAHSGIPLPALPHAAD